MAAAILALAIALGAVASRAGSLLVVERPVEDPDAIVMLASHEWERLPAAAALAREHPSSRVLLTEPRVVSALNCHRCPERAQLLVQEGVLPSRIRVLPDRARNTYEEAAAVLVHWQQARFARLAVVTSPYHARRSLATFREVFRGLSVQVGVHPASATSSAAPGRWWLRYDDVRYVVYEWAAVAYYRLKYGVPMALSTTHGRVSQEPRAGAFSGGSDAVAGVRRIPPLVAEAEQEDSQDAKQLRREH